MSIFSGRAFANGLDTSVIGGITLMLAIMFAVLAFCSRDLRWDSAKSMSSSRWNDLTVAGKLNIVECLNVVEVGYRKKIAGKQCLFILPPPRHPMAS
jgi:hypothetical protein